MRSLPYTEFQTALYGRLTTDVATSGYVVYDAGSVPVSASFPYYTLDLIDGLNRDSKSTVSNEVQFAVNAHTRYPVGGNESSPAPLHTMMDAAEKALTRTPITLTGDHTNIFIRLESAPRRTHSDEKYTYREGSIIGRAHVQYTP